MGFLRILSIRLKTVFELVISQFFCLLNLFVKLTNVFFLEEEILLENLIIFVLPRAGVVKLVDTLDLGSSASRLGGSSPFTRTKAFFREGFFCMNNFFIP